VVAIAAPADAVACVGIDIEDVHRLSQAAANRILSETEMDWVRGSTRLASLVFSAKEAIYKAYYPHYRRSANFKDVDVIPIENTPCMRVMANPERFSQKWVQQIEQFTVRYTFIDSYVLCCSYLLKFSSAKKSVNCVVD
jgi:phosphopantetheine--protein transferase-like protein